MSRKLLVKRTWPNRPWLFKEFCPPWPPLGVGILTLSNCHFVPLFHAPQSCPLPDCKLPEVRSYVLILSASPLPSPVWELQDTYKTDISENGRVGNSNSSFFHESYEYLAKKLRINPFGILETKQKYTAERGTLSKDFGKKKTKIKKQKTNPTLQRQKQT